MQYIAKTLITDPTGRYLLLRRSSTHPRYAFHLDLPGGEVEEGEEILLGGAREIVEETGLKISTNELREVHRQQVTETKTYIVLEGIYSEPNPDISISWEHDGYLWLNHNELLTAPRPDGMDDYMGVVLEYLEQKQT